MITARLAHVSDTPRCCASGVAVERGCQAAHSSDCQSGQVIGEFRGGGQSGMGRSRLDNWDRGCWVDRLSSWHWWGGRV